MRAVTLSDLIRATKDTVRLILNRLRASNEVGDSLMKSCEVLLSQDVSHNKGWIAAGALVSVWGGTAQVFTVSCPFSRAAILGI
jgi:hypothetical protein